MSVAISSLPSIWCSNQTWVSTSKCWNVLYGPARVHADIRHSSVWIYGGQVPVNSKSGIQASVNIGEWKPVLWKVQSCWVDTFLNSYGWFRTFQYKSPSLHTQLNREGISPQRTRARSFSRRTFPNPNTTIQIILKTWMCIWKCNAAIVG